MKLFTGTKTIKAKPMNFYEYTHNIKGEQTTAPNQEGYMVGYADAKGVFDGEEIAGCHYISWSPKDVFEASYAQHGDVPEIADGKKTEGTDIPDYQQRVIDEKSELDGKLERLTSFTDTSMFNELGKMDGELLLDQMKAMQSYTEILFARIDRFK